MAGSNARPWRILVVDDEDDMHVVTRAAIRRVTFAGRGVEMISAHSARKAMQELTEDRTFALVLLDVKMETPTAGLDLVKWIRTTLGNQAVRIILRTGHPGEVPEASVIADYDINDYKEKGELDIGRLRTCLISSFRAYRQIRELEMVREHLRTLIESSDMFTRLRNLELFAQSILGQISAMIDPETGMDSVIFLRKAGGQPGSNQNDRPELEMFSVIGQWRYDKVASVEDLDPTIVELARNSVASQDNIYQEGAAALYFAGSEGEIVAYVEYPGVLSDVHKALLSLFATRMARNLLRARRLELDEGLSEVETLRNRVAELEAKLAAAGRSE